MAPMRMVREALKALSDAGLAVESRERAFLPARDLAQITFAQVRAAGRKSVRFPQRDDNDAVDRALIDLWDHADVAAEGALTETLASFIARAFPGDALRDAPGDAHGERPRPAEGKEPLQLPHPSRGSRAT
jgi:hypothetical protein